MKNETETKNLRELISKIAFTKSFFVFSIGDEIKLNECIKILENKIEKLST